MSEYIAGLTHKAYRVRNMEESLRFYSDCLGLKKMFCLKDENGRDWLYYLHITGRQYMELFYDGTAEAGIDMGEHICFEVQDIRKTVERIRSFGYSTILNNAMEPVHGRDHNEECFVRDPDGNLIELMQFGADAIQFDSYEEPKVLDWEDITKLNRDKKGEK